MSHIWKCIRDESIDSNAEAWCGNMWLGEKEICKAVKDLRLFQLTFSPKSTKIYVAEEDNNSKAGTEESKSPFVN